MEWKLWLAWEKDIDKKLVQAPVWIKDFLPLPNEDLCEAYVNIIVQSGIF